MRIEFTVPAVPVAQPRPRATAISGMARMYEAKKEHPVHAFKAAVKMAAREAYSGPPLEGPLRVWLQFVFPRLSSTPKSKLRVPKFTKPDVDNLAKSVCDSLNNLTYKDDGQICALQIEKLNAATDEQPFVWVCIETM